MSSVYRLHRILMVGCGVLSLATSARGESPDLAALDQYISQAVKAWDVPGLSIAIVKDDHVVLAKGFGVRAQGSPELVDADTLFAIASNTKAFTAAALAMLVESGKLKWSDRVQDHLPYFRLYDPYVSAEMRIEDLLCHRSGLGTFSGDLLWFGTSYSAEDILRRARHLPAAGGFRTHYGYSNLMYLAAGEVVSQVSGQSWPDFVQQRILQPLHMDRTCLSVRALDSLENVAAPHKNKLDGVCILPWANWDTVAAVGGMISSANDMSQWLRLQLREGRLDDQQSLFSTASAQRMWAPHTIIPLGASSREHYPTTHFRSYGLGWALSDYKGRLTVGHGGGYDGMYSRVLMVPEEKLGVVVLTNSMTGISTALANRVVDEYLGGEQSDWSGEGLQRDSDNRQKFYERIVRTITPSAADTQPSHTLEDFAGSYQSELYGEVKITLENCALALSMTPTPHLVADLTHLHYDTFVIHWRKESAWFNEGTAQFIMDGAGKITQLKLDVPNDDFWFSELELKRAK